MITDDQLYSLAIFLGCMSMLLIVLYHFLEVNAKEGEKEGAKDTSPANKTSAAAPKSNHGITTAAAAGQGMRAEKGGARPVHS